MSSPAPRCDNTGPPTSLRNNYLRTPLTTLFTVVLPDLNLPLKQFTSTVSRILLFDSS